MEEDQDFEGNIQDLNSDTCLQDPTHARLKIKLIAKSFNAELSHFSIEIFVASALDDQTGVLAFIRKTAFRDTHKDVVLDALSLLDELIKNYTKFIESYFVNVINTCIYVLNSGQNAYMKVNALKLIQTVVETPVRRDIKIEDLIGKLKDFLAKEKNLTPTIRGEIFIILGKIYESYPGVIDGSKEWFLGKILGILNFVMKEAKHKSQSTYHGCFEGLKGYFSQFSLDEQEKIQDIYKCLKFHCKYEEGQRHVTNRSALEFFEKAPEIFDGFVYKDCEEWLGDMEIWLKSNNKDDKRSGFNAIVAFYKKIVRFIDKEKPENGQEIFKNFFKYFCGKIRAEYKVAGFHSYQTWSAIIGIGEFSLLKEYSDDEDLSGIFQEIIKFAQNLDPEKNSSYFPIYVECISKYVSKLDGAKIDELVYLQKLSVLLIEQYPKIDGNYQSQSAEALEKSFYCLADCGMHVLDNHINEVVYQGLIRSVVHTPWIDVEVQREAGEDVSQLISYKSYLNLWNYLLNLGKSKICTNVPHNVKTGMAGKICDGFIVSFLRILRKLNLEISEKDLISTDLEESLEASNPKDFQIFINVVDLYQDLLPLVESSFWNKWFGCVLKEMVECSYKSPLISGFYKIISTTLKSADEERFFEDNPEFSEILIKYLEDVLVKVNLYKGDLQIACLQVLLSAPVCLIEGFAEKTVSVFHVILRVGRGYFPILQKCIETLERWYDDLPEETMKSLLRKILPHFDLFLQSKGFRDPKFEKLPEQKSGRKVKKKIANDPNDSQLLMLQRRFLIFLGRLDPSVTVVLTETEEETRNFEKNLQYRLPFPDIKPAIHLDGILPRVMDLALSCGDRSTRMTACELFHSIIMVALGNMKQMSGGMTKIFRQVFQNCLILGCDTDHVVKQLFEPLCFQIVRYFSGKQQRGTAETVVVIEVLMDGVSHPYDSSVRDFSASNVKEFIKWSIKHLTPEELRQTPENIRAILRGVYSFALHPSYNKRLGAAVVFNNIYTILREEEFILDAYWFEIYFHFLESLKMSEEKEDKTQVLTALRHVQRPLLEKYHLFNQNSRVRKRPPGFENVLLSDLLQYTMNQCVSTKPSVREISKKLTEELLVKLPDCKSLRDFITNYMSGRIPEIEPCKEKTNTPEWLAYHDAYFDYYGWLIQKKGIDPSSNIHQVGNNFALKVSSSDDDVRSETLVIFLKFLNGFDDTSFVNQEVWTLIAACIFEHNIDNSLIIDFLSRKTPADLEFFFEKCNSYEIPDFSRSLSQNTLNPSCVNYLRAVQIFRSAKIFLYLNTSTLQNLNGEILLNLIFNSLFVQRFKKTHAVDLEPSVKHFAEDLFKFAVTNGPVEPDKIVEILANKEEVIVESTNEKTTKGDYFLLIYKNVIYDFFIDNYSTVIDVVFKDETSKSLELLISVLQNMHSLGRTKNYKEIAKKIFSKWDDFVNLDHYANKNVLLFSLLKSLIKLHPAQIGFLRHEEKITKWVYKILKHGKISLDEVESVFTLLPHLTDFWEESGDNSELRIGLMTFWRMHKFFSGEGSFSQAEFGVLTFMYDRLFFSFKKTASLLILNFILKIIPKHIKLLKEDKMDGYLKLFVEQTPNVHFLRVAKFCYEFCFVKDSDAEAIAVISKRVLNFILIESNHNWNFVVDKIDDLLNLVMRKFEKTIVAELKQEIARKIAALTLVETLFHNVRREEIPFTEKRAVFQTFILHCSSMKERCTNIETADLHRKYLCACFNALCAIFMQRGSPGTVYEKFLFRPESNKSCWRYLVDNEKEFDLTMDFAERPKLKKFLTSLRRTISNEQRKQLGRTLNSVKYLQSQTLFESSLNEDVAKFDFSNSPIRSLDSVQNVTNRVEITLEIDSLNDHESMVELISTVGHMVKENIAPLPTGDVYELPCWLQSFLGVLDSRESAENTKLFVLKALYNINHIYDFLKPYVNDVFKPILFAINDLLDRRPINYFVIDLIVMMVEWKVAPEADEATRTVLTVLVGKLIEKTDSLRRDIVRDNIELVKTIVEIYKTLLVTEELSKIVFERFGMESGEKKSNEIMNYMNLHLGGILLANGIAPWVPGQQRVFLNKVFDIFEKDMRNNQLAGGTIGLVLSYSTDEHDFVVQKIQRKNWGSNVLLLYSIHAHYPQIGKEFNSSIVTATWNSAGIFKTNCLEMILSYVTQTDQLEDDMFATTIDTFLPNMMKPDDGTVANLALQIFEKIISKIPEVKLIKIAKIALNFKDNKTPAIRKTVYDIAIKIFEKYEDDLFENEELSDLKEKSRLSLLKGLTDPDGNLRDKCVEFFSNRTSKTTFARLSYILRDLYASELDSGFLDYATRLLLESTKSTQDYSEKMFEHPIHECEFRDHNVLMRATHSTIAPMFAQTLTSQLNRTQSLETLPDDFLLRRTIESLVFQPTAADEEKTFVTDRVEEMQVDENFKMPSRPPRRRYLKNTEALAQYFAKRETTKKRIALELDIDRKKKRDTHVELYRNYRIGDYPDIQIQHCQLLKPLEVLIRRDTQIASHFLISLIVAIVDRLNFEQSKTILKIVNDRLDGILKTCANPAIVSFGFELALKYDKKIELDTTSVKNSAKLTGRMQLGALLIEQIIINKEGEVEDVPKRRKGNETTTSEAKRWLQLGELYHDLKEFDVLRGIFIDKLTVSEDINEAIHCESVLDWSAAAQCYENVFKNGVETQHANFYNESFFNCLANLSNWKKLNECIRTTVDDDLSKLWKEDQVLPWFLKSQMMLGLDLSGFNHDVFKKLIADFMKDKEKATILLNKFPEELAVSEFFWNKLQKASYYVDQEYLQFLENWSHLNRWSGPLRSGNVINLQLTTELFDILSVLSDSSLDVSERKLRKISGSWMKNKADPQNDLMIWDVKLSYRQKFWKILQEEDKIELEDVTRNVVKSELNLVAAALEQDNFYLSRAYLRKVANKLGLIEDGDLNLNHEYYHFCAKILKAKHTLNDLTNGLMEYTKIWRDIERRISAIMDTDSDSVKLFLNRMYLSLGRVTSTLVSFVDAWSDQVTHEISEIIGGELQDVVENTKIKGLEYLKTAVELSENAKSHLFLANYYREHISENENGLIESLLKAIKLGNFEARQLFCCVLTMTDFVKDENFLGEIKREVEEIPIWMFLMWTNQMLATLDTDMFPFVSDILMRIAEEYPNAIRYPFRISSEKYKYEQGKKLERFVNRLKNTLSNPLYDNFIRALHYVGPPNLMLKYYLSKILDVTKRLNGNRAEIEDIFKVLFDHLYSEHEVIKGPIFDVVNTLKPRLETLRNIENDDEFSAELEDILKHLSDHSSKSQKVFLKSYTSWLSDFQSLKYDSSLEIPGQYDGLAKPNLKYHVLISSFKYDVVELQSKCKPLKVTILGNDAREYKFLIKFSEDLRQDQRIQQFFNHVNYNLRKNKQTKNFSIDTYNVIPLSTNLGMIQWVDDASSLLELMKMTHEGEQSFELKTNEIRSDHLFFLSKKNLTNIILLQLLGYENVNRDEAIRRYNESAQAFPWDLLRKSFWKLSSCPEHFTYLRGNFAVSQAVTYAAHWLMGIGDRHLQNTLVSTKTGRVLGIDFGCAFGYATQFLRIPEFVPFRLTPQIVNLLKPLNESGWIKQTMIHCLRSFRKECSVFLAILEVFALEPSLDWLEQAKNNPRNEGAQINENWYPKEKIDTVKRKLRGENPVSIYERDVKNYHCKYKQSEKYLEVLRGVNENVRARLPMIGLTEEQQVDCLIDLATDRHVLAKTYVGWDPWL